MPVLPVAHVELPPAVEREAVAAAEAGRELLALAALERDAVQVARCEIDHQQAVRPIDQEAVGTFHQRVEGGVADEIDLAAGGDL